MAQDWYYSRAGGSQMGPVSMADLQRMAREGALLPADLLWQEGLPSWQAANTVPGVFAAPANDPAPAYAPPPAPSPRSAPAAAGPERAPRPAPSPFAGMEGPKLWEILKWASLGVGGLFLLISFVVNAFWAGAMAGTGCFFGIVSRIMQAEQHQAADASRKA